MAERVALHQEKSIPEYEAFKKYRIMDDEDLRKYKSKIDDFEYKLNGGKKSISTYAEYIIYEKHILSLVIKSEARQNVDMKNLKKAILKRIIKLYEEGTLLFPSEYFFWDSYIEFCKNDMPEKVSRLYDKCLLHHGKQSLLWCSALCWQYEYGKNYNKTKHLFYKATLCHPESEILYTTFFGILLAEPVDCKTTDLSGRLARLYLVYKFARKNICNCSFLLSLLEQCEDANCSTLTIISQKLIIDDLIANFPFSEKLWNALAQRELRGFCMNDLQKAPKIKIDANTNSIKVENESQNATIAVDINDAETEIDSESVKNLCQDEFWKKRTLKRRIELCCKAYMTAVQTVKTTQMMDMYLNSMLKINSNVESLASFKRKMLATAFKLGHEYLLMSAEHYGALIKMLLENNSNKVLDVVTTATELHKSFKLYQLRLSIVIAVNVESKVLETFRLATKNLPVLETIQLWVMLLEYYTKYSKEYKETLQQLFEEACRNLRPQFEVFRSMYLDWCVKSLGIEKTRKEYDIMTKYPPPSLIFHQKMATIELSQINPNIERLRLCHENIVHFFGKMNADIWMDYIIFEKKHGDPGRTSLLYQRAKQYLSADLIDKFIESFSFSTVKM